MYHPRFWMLVSLTLALAMTRVVPHPWHFTPVGAMALFGGAYFARNWAAFGVPLGALFLSDLALAVSQYGFRDTLLAMPVVYLTFALIVGIGMLLRGRQRVLPITAAAIAAALVHFAITNFPALMLSHSTPTTPEAVLTSYAAGLPFLKNMLYSNLIFCAILFGGFALAQRRFPVLREPALAATP